MVFWNYYYTYIYFNIVFDLMVNNNIRFVQVNNFQYCYVYYI